jgi:hypothetical protein
VASSTSPQCGTCGPVRTGHARQRRAWEQRRRWEGVAPKGVPAFRSTPPPRRACGRAGGGARLAHLPRALLAGLRPAVTVLVLPLLIGARRTVLRTARARRSCARRSQRRRPADDERWQHHRVSAHARRWACQLRRRQAQRVSAHAERAARRGARGEGAAPACTREPTLPRTVPHAAPCQAQRSLRAAVDPRTIARASHVRSSSHHACALAPAAPAAGSMQAATRLAQRCRHARRSPALRCAAPAARRPCATPRRARRREAVRRRARLPTCSRRRRCAGECLVVSRRVTSRGCYSRDGDRNRTPSADCCEGGGWAERRRRAARVPVSVPRRGGARARPGGSAASARHQYSIPPSHGSFGAGARTTLNTCPHTSPNFPAVGGKLRRPGSWSGAEWPIISRAVWPLRRRTRPAEEGALALPRVYARGRRGQACAGGSFGAQHLLQLPRQTSATNRRANLCRLTPEFT